MIKWPYSIKELHIEPTDVCNAACPACLRETDKNFNKSTRHELSVDFFANTFSLETIKNLDKVFACGNYGDPAASAHLLEIFKWLKFHNPNITLGINTNGSIRSTAWWEELAVILSGPRDYVVFSIDGLEDTNHIYRVNCNWKKIIENAQAFIGAGGSAHWDMLVFEHNQHQVIAAQELAREMGFTWFRCKVSKREMPMGFNVPDNFTKPTHKSGPIRCVAERSNGLYVSATGRIFPCCWLATTEWDINTWTNIQQSWSTKSIERCASVCSTSESGSTRFSDQWQLEVQFNAVSTKK